MPRVLSYIRYIVAVICMICSYTAIAQDWNPGHSVGTVTGKYTFSSVQVPDQLVELGSPTISVAVFTYLWESSLSPVFATYGTAAGVANGSSYSFTIALTQTTYFRRKTTHATLGTLVSNTIKITVGSINWEDRNYVREQTILKSGVTTFTAADNLVIGDKLMMTSYMDGMGRDVQKVGKEIATPATTGGTWGDLVAFNVFDAYGREVVNYLPYTSANQPGKYKLNPATDQQQYYTTNFTETSAFSAITYDNSPSMRLNNVKEPGATWAAGQGVGRQYLLNTTSDDVRILKVDYIAGNAPTYVGAYPAGTLYKSVQIDQHNKSTVEYLNKSGQVILRKVQIDDVPLQNHTGWACTYYVYDDFGQLRCTIQPEATTFLNGNGWSFAATNGPQVLDGYCFQYFYDSKGRVTWKKTPGALALRMLYDSRDRLVFSQDGNQSVKSPAEWTAYLYDALDRVYTEVLYKTTKTPAQLQTDINSGTPVSATDLANTSVCTITKYNYYDNYSYAGVKAFDNSYDNGSAYPTTDPNVLPIASNARTLSMLTGTKVRVLGTTTFLLTSFYYNTDGLLTQSLSDNIKTGTDVTTYQYGFDGRLLSTHTKHTTTSSGYTSFPILTKNTYDKIGRITAIDKKFGTNAFESIAEYSYDDLGRLKKKRLDPGYTGTGKTELESLEYSYNLNGMLTGINKDYALKTVGKYDKWGNFFGIYLGFDNKDNMFSAARLNGQVGGVLWNTQGDDVQRKYDISYDNAGRLKLANYNERATTGAAWNKTTMDFSVTSASGAITYDLNGNLLTLLHKGVVPGTAAPVTIDQLTYTYASYSNKLAKVGDGSPLTTTNGKFGDFKDGANGSTDDYVFDNNGNLVKDLNKEIKDLVGETGAKGIRYNYLDKPEEINLAGKGNIKFVYTADGERVQKIFTPVTGPVVTTSYIEGFVYVGDQVQFINFEEGRLRVIQEVNVVGTYDQLQITGNITLPNSKKGVYDYFIRDYQENVRMILTEEQHLGSNQATMETTRSTIEEPLFGQPGTGNEVVQTRFAVASIPGQGGGTGWNNASIGAQVSRVGKLAPKKTGPNALLKVMAGDQVSSTVLYYYKSAVVNSTTSNGLAADVLLSLGQAIVGSPVTSDLAKGGSGGITGLLGSSAPFNAAAAPDATNATGTAPKAYLTVLFFDERFNYVGENSTFQRVSAANTSNASLSALNIKAPKNGYAFVYVSNESDEMVYFDNFQVSHTRGRIIEENHYYAYGLKISGISSKKVGDANEGHLSNKNLYNDKELDDDADLNLYDFGFRTYDAQIGRFIQIDP